MESATHLFSEALLKPCHNILESFVDAISFIVNQRLHSVWELPAKAVNIMVLLSGRRISESPGGSLTRIVYQLGHYSTRSTRINSDFGIVSDDLDGTNRGLSGHSFQRHLAIPRPALEFLLACGVLWGSVGREIETWT